MLSALLAQDFAVQSAHCHLARLFLAQGQEDRARQHAAQAWDVLDGAPPHAVARTVWLQALFAVIDNGDCRPWIGRLKALPVERSTLQSWSMTPVLDRLRWRLPYHDVEMMAALLRVVSGEDERPSLNRHAWWAGA